MPLFNATPTPQRLPRVLRCLTRIILQVKVAGTIALCREQGDAQNASNGGGAGIEFTNANTSGPMQPESTWWQGEIWYVQVGGVAGSSVPFVLELLSEEGIA